jgi:hypothetical protein
MAQDLYGIWEELGGAWAEAAANEAGAQETADSPGPAAPELSPQQLQLVQEHFDRVRCLPCIRSRHSPRMTCGP